jgi:hypothetical protein
MKVLCINGINKGEAAWDTHNAASENDSVYEGVIYTVVRWKEYRGIIFYFLAEKRRNACYYSGLFIPCSEQDEMELVNQRENTLTV